MTKRLAIASAAAILALLAIGVPALAALRAPGAPATAYAGTTLGYEVQLPGGWRRSSALSTFAYSNVRKVGHEVFTIRGVADESAALADPGPGAAWQWVAVVEQYRDPERYSALAWATDPLLAGWAKGQLVEQTTLDGRAAVKVTNGARFSVAYYIEDRGRMYVVGYKTDTPSWKPAAATEADLVAIVRSFHIAP